MSNADLAKVSAMIEQVPQVKSWLTHLQDKVSSSYDLYRFCQWAKLTPTLLLALKSNPADKSAEHLLDQFISDEPSGFSNAVKSRIAANVKSYFKWSYCALERACGIVIYEKVKPTNMPTKANLRKLWDWCMNPRDRALLTFILSTAIAKGSIVQLKWSHLEPDWEKIEYPCINLPPTLLKGHGRGKYRGVQQITFLTPEAKRDLLTYREWIQQKIHRALTADDYIFLEACEPFKPINYLNVGNLFNRLSHKAGVAFSAHDARRYVNTALEQTNISQNWAHKIRGRKVRGEEAPYSRPAIDQLRAKFAEAVPLLQFTTDQLSSALEKRVTNMEAFLASLTPEQREQGRKAGYMMRSTDAVKRSVEKYMENNPDKKSEESGEPQPEDKKCEDGVHCPQFKQISGRGIAKIPPRRLDSNAQLSQWAGYRLSAQLTCSIKAFNSFIGPKIRNEIKILTKQEKRKIGNVCQECGKKAELESAHLQGNDRLLIINGVLKKYVINEQQQIIQVNLDEVVKEIIAAHLPIAEHFRFLCPECHRKYDRNIAD